MENISQLSVIDKDACIHDLATVGPFCEIYAGSYVSPHCIIQSHVRIATDVLIGEYVTIKFGTCITDKTVIESHVFIGPNVNILGDHKRKLHDYTSIGIRSFIGAGTSIAPGITIGPDVIVGANSFVNKNILLSGVYVGTPIKRIK